MTETCPTCHAERELTKAGVCETCLREIAAGRMNAECRQTALVAVSAAQTVFTAVGSCRQSTLF